MPLPRPFPQSGTARAASCLLLAALCAGCGGNRSAWNGRRGYDGRGDYGYDLNASRAESSSYRARAARSYPVPGTPDDPWGPHIHEAAARFQVPEQWVRAVMHQESGGRLYDSDGGLITSGAGAMGLMQVMPATYDTLRRRYSLGDDPYDPHDNIMAGTAYIREMYDRYGSPGFLAAYNAGPARLDASLSGGMPLPDETTNYVASIAPHLGTQVAMTGPMAAYAGGSDADRAYAGGGMSGAQYYGGGGAAADDASARAFDGGGLVTASAPTGVMTAQLAAPRPVVQAAPVEPVAAVAVYQPVSAIVPPRGNWAIQVGAYPDPANSRAAIAAARARAGDLLAGAQEAIIPVQRSVTLYRARLTGLSADAAGNACARLGSTGLDCFAVPPGS